MKKVKQWEKPELGVLDCSKTQKYPDSFRTGRALSHIGPAPAPPMQCSGAFRSRKAQSHIGPAPAPAPHSS